MTVLYLIVALILNPHTGETSFNLSVKAYPTEEACEAAAASVPEEYAQEGIQVLKIGCAATKAGGLSI